VRAAPRIPIAVALAVCVLLAACSSGRDDAASPSPRPTDDPGTAAPSTTATAPTNPAQVTALRLDPYETRAIEWSRRLKVTRE